MTTLTEEKDRYPGISVLSITETKTCICKNLYMGFHNNIPRGQTMERTQMSIQNKWRCWKCYINTIAYYLATKCNALLIYATLCKP